MSSKEPKAVNPILVDFVRSLLMPMLVGKTMIYFFGLQYSQYPGEGWGYGLAFSILFTVGGLLRFIWKYRHVQDP
ncbi:MAG: hypothetical protein KF767_16555 [Bdellovibrionaceae bacterium]|nr:hypothetical protein [Pseudobdellovibrionaceae bacterium]